MLDEYDIQDLDTLMSPSSGSFYPVLPKLRRKTFLSRTSVSVNQVPLISGSSFGLACGVLEDLEVDLHCWEGWQRRRRTNKNCRIPPILVQVILMGWLGACCR